MGGRVIIIPARYDSKRFPGKVLADINGWPMIRHVYERARRARGIDRVLVATDCGRIKEVVESFGGEAVMTSPDRASGTDRIAEVARGLDCEIVVNVQGDEPLIDPRAIEQLLGAFDSEHPPEMATLAAPLDDSDELADPNVVKVVADLRGMALYFSRAVIPFPDGGPPRARKHIGVYAYRKDFLLAFAGLEQTPLELSERLEQLRALEHGHSIRIVDTNYQSFNVDTPEHLEKVARMLAAEKGSSDGG